MAYFLSQGLCLGLTSMLNPERDDEMTRIVGCCEMPADPVEDQNQGLCVWHKTRKPRPAHN